MSPFWRRRVVGAYKFGTSKVPPVLRSLLGLVLIALGCLGFLPILGFWMIPLGLFFIALDIPRLRRLVRRRLLSSRTERSTRG